jgi:hypothetical protein
VRNDIKSMAVTGTTWYQTFLFSNRDTEFVALADYELHVNSHSRWLNTPFRRRCCLQNQIVDVYTTALHWICFTFEVPIVPLIVSYRKLRVTSYFFTYAMVVHPAHML